MTLCDSGASEHYRGAGGTLPVDDEGVPAGRTVIIENGILTSYLHDRESAARFGVAPTGNARAWEHSDVPLIRMRNTYIEPGTSELEAMIAGIDDGFFLDGPRNGQADSTGEFMFGVQQAWRIRKGKRCELVRGVTVSGIAFDVMRSVDAVSKDFLWDLGSGHCGKGQPARVDAGGPYLSGSTNPVSGDFSGVAKNAYRVRGGARTPIAETMIQKNLLRALHAISGISRERRLVWGSAQVPALRVDGISVTAGG